MEKKEKTEEKMFMFSCLYLSQTKYILNPNQPLPLNLNIIPK